MTIQDIRIFLTVAHTKNISRAASSLYISQSTISRKISGIEEELGITLFYRSKGRDQMYLTSHGEAFLSMANSMNVLYENALEIKKTVSRMQLNISLVDSVGIYLLSPFLNNMVNKHPEISYICSLNHSSEVFRNLRDHISDVGIANMPSTFPNQNSEILFEEDYVIIHKNPEYPSVISPDSLDASHEIYQHFSLSFEQWKSLWWTPGQSKVTVNITKQAQAFFTEPQDWGIVPFSVGKYMKENEGFRISELSSKPPKRVVYLITRRDLPAYLVPAAETFVTELKDFIHETQSSSPPARSAARSATSFA